MKLALATMLLLATPRAFAFASVRPSIASGARSVARRASSRPLLSLRGRSLSSLLALRSGGGEGEARDLSSAAASGLGSLSVSELKTLLGKRGIDIRDCVEKRELVERLSDSIARGDHHQVADGRGDRDGVGRRGGGGGVQDLTESEVG